MSSSEVTDSEKVAPLIVRCRGPHAILAHLVATSELQHALMEKNRNSRFRGNMAGARVCDSASRRLLFFDRQL